MKLDPDKKRPQDVAPISPSWMRAGFCWFLTWAPPGRTPHLRCAGHWTKVSAISALTVSPRRRRIALYARFHALRNIRSAEVVAFLRRLLRHLRGPVFLL